MIIKLYNKPVTGMEITPKNKKQKKKTINKNKRRKNSVHVKPKNISFLVYNFQVVINKVNYQELKINKCIW